MSAAVPPAITDFLGMPTPGSWVDAALQALPDLVVDHANCEKKAAATAMSLMNRYPDHESIVRRMSPLAREELRHFEQVTRLMKKAGMQWRHVCASRYAAGLRERVADREPERLVDGDRVKFRVTAIGGLDRLRRALRFNGLIEQNAGNTLGLDTFEQAIEYFYDNGSAPRNGL